MFERFTKGSRQAMVLTEKVARARGDDFISATHIALGLIESDRQSGSGLFAKLGVDVAELEAALHAEADRDKKPKTPGGGRFTPAAKKVLEKSLREALRLRQRWIGPGHMLLGILDSAGSAAVLERLPLDGARAAIAEWEAERPTVEQSAGAESEGSSAVSRGFGEIMKTAMSVGPKPIGSQHLLLAMFQVENTLARKVLEALGLHKERVAMVISNLGTQGTLDDPPQPEYEVRVGDQVMRVDDAWSRDMLREILDKDPDLAERIRVAIERRVKEAGN